MEGSSILVTGASRRLGRAIALALAESSSHVALHHRASEEDAQETARLVRERGAEADVFAADLSSIGDTLDLAARVVERFGPIDVLVNNASAFYPTPLDETDPEALARAADEFHAVHVRAPLLLTRALLPGMRARGGGCVVNLTDAALDAPRARFAPYLASKAALEAMTRSLARELAPEVRVNAVAPGAILPPPGASAEEAKRIARRVPAGRMGTPEELAAAVVFCVRGPGFVSGATIRVDGAQYG